MSQLKLIKSHNDFTAVPDVFLDDFMPAANGEFVKVYLLILRYAGSCGETDLTHIADILNMTESDVVRALKYWNEAGVLSVSFSEDGQPESVSFADLNREETETSGTDEISVSDEVLTAPEKPSVPARPSYSPSQLVAVSKKEDIEQLFFVAERLLGKQLSTTDMNTILYIHDELGFSPDLTEYLFEYCVSNNHTSLRYIETVALSWYGKNIVTVEQAKSECTMFSRRVSPVMKAFGIKGRNITDAELAYINKWYDEYGFDRELIDEACRRTVLAIGNPNFNYADGILRKWQKSGVRNLEDVSGLDSKVRAQVKIPVVTSKSTNRAGSFSKFPQRDYKYDDLEKKLIKK